VGRPKGSSHARTSRGVPDGGDLGKTDSGLDERLYYLTDSNACPPKPWRRWINVTALVQGTPDHQDLGHVVERYRYDPYGRVTVLDGEDGVDPDTTPGGDDEEWSTDPNNASDYDNEIRFCGYRYDPESALYHVRNRMYHATLGRWLQRDPLGYVDGMSLYEYCGSRPVTGSDPWGLADYPKQKTVPKPDVYVVSQNTPAEQKTVFKGYAEGQEATYTEVSTAQQARDAINEQFKKNKQDPNREDPKVKAVIVADPGQRGRGPSVNKKKGTKETESPLFGEDIVRDTTGDVFDAGASPAGQWKPDQITPETVKDIPIGPALENSSQVTFTSPAVPSSKGAADRAEENYDKISKVTGCEISGPRGGSSVTANYDSTTIRSKSGIYTSKR